MTLTHTEYRLSQLDELETIMSEEDNDLIKWITGEKPVPERYRTPLFERIAAIRPDFDWPRNGKNQW